MLNAGGLTIQSRSEDGVTRPTLKVVFRIELSVQKSANSAEVSITNLNKDSRSFLEQATGATGATATPVTTSIEAGYVGGRSRIFLGDLDWGSTVRSGTDWVTSLQSRDGAIASQERVAQSFSNIKIGDLLKKLVESTSLDVGNVADAIKGGPKRGSATEFINGIVANGIAIDEIDRIARQFGLRFSIQGNEANFITPTEAFGGRAIVLSETTGLIGSPEPGEKGVVNSRTLLQPELLPGQAVEYQADQVKGNYRVERVVFVGDTWGTDWYCELETKPI